MLMILPLLLAAAPANAPDVIGRWDLKAGDATIFRMEVTRDLAGAKAVWERPEQYDTDGESFSHVKGPVIHRQARSIRAVGADLELIFDDPRPGATPDKFLLHRVNADHMDVSYEGTGFEPFDFVRTTIPQSSEPGPWDPSRTYLRLIDRPTNAEMTAIFNADQADRRGDDIDWSVVDPADRKRRARTQQLLDSGALQSGEDFYNAAFVFQHGDTAADYPKAQGKPQVLGTQFALPKDAPVTQEPYDRAFASDAMRRALHVPSLAEQERQRLEFARKAAATTNSK